EEQGGRGRTHHDEVDVLGDEVRALERLAGGVDREIGGGFVALDHVPLADPAALLDPRVVRVDHRCEVGVGEDPLRGGGARTGDLRPLHPRPPSSFPRATSYSSAALMWSLSPAFAHSRATRTAFLIAFTGDAP